MANQLYGYSSSCSSSYRGATSSSSLSAAARSLTGSYFSDRIMSRYYFGSHSDSDHAKYSPAMYHTHASPSTPPPGVDVPASISGLKRSSEALYHATVLDAHNTIGQTEAWYSTNSLAKRSRYESAINFSIYPQRPGEKDCAHYMLTRTCKFGDSCKFDHPIWVPEGGIPNWKEVPLAAITEPLPERPGQPDCPYFLKTQRCMYGAKCKFNHPKDKSTLGGSQSDDVLALPERPSEPICAFYVKTGRCKFGATCKFHHPKDIQISSGQENGNSMQKESAAEADESVGDVNAVKPFVYNPALLHNSKGLPIRPGEVDCPFYLKTGSCKYGATCRYNHPDRSEINPPAAALGHSFTGSSVAGLNIGVVDPATSVYQAIDPRFAQPMLGLGMTIYPQRPGQAECDYYMKSGECKFGERCKFHHPIDRSAPTAAQAQQAIKLTLAGLPRREDAVHCPYYMKTGTCKYGATCKFDHPPPGEVMVNASSQGTSDSADDA